jgi:aldehyde:ferredoxin oxidoreductase
LTVSVRGAYHLTAAVHNFELAGQYWKFKGIDRFDFSWKGYQVKAGEDLTTLYDIFGACKFSRQMFFLEGLVELYNVLSGLEQSPGEIILMGERVYNLQKMFNVREGWKRSEDTLPYRITHEPIPKGASKGAILAEVELEKMLDQYYMARGWSKKGVPTNFKLVSLDILDVVGEEIGSGI